MFNKLKNKAAAKAGLVMQAAKGKMVNASKSEEEPELKAVRQSLKLTKHSFEKSNKILVPVFLNDADTPNPGVAFLDSNVTSAIKTKDDYKILFAACDVAYAKLEKCKATIPPNPDATAKAEQGAEQATQTLEAGKASLMQANKAIEVERDSVWQAHIDAACSVLRALQPKWEGDEMPRQAGVVKHIDDDEPVSDVNSFLGAGSATTLATSAPAPTHAVNSSDVNTAASPAPAPQTVIPAVIPAVVEKEKPRADSSDDESASVPTAAKLVEGAEPPSDSDSD